MTANAKTRRRWFGAVCLLAAITMLIAGETVLNGRMQPLALVTYWSACFILTGLAAGTALIEMLLGFVTNHAVNTALSSRAQR